MVVWGQQSSWSNRKTEKQGLDLKQASPQVIERKLKARETEGKEKKI